MFKTCAFVVVLVALSVQQSEAAIKCHSCFEACEASKAKEITCGQAIGEAQEAVCTTEVPKDSKTPNVAIRACKIVVKNRTPDCPPNAVCTSCKTDLCNSAVGVGSNALLMGVVSLYMATRCLFY